MSRDELLKNVQGFREGFTEPLGIEVQKPRNPFVNQDESFS